MCTEETHNEVGSSSSRQVLYRQFQRHTISRIKLIIMSYVGPERSLNGRPTESPSARQKTSTQFSSLHSLSHSSLLLSHQERVSEQHLLEAQAIALRLVTSEWPEKGGSVEKSRPLRLSLPRLCRLLTQVTWFVREHLSDINTVEPR